MSTSKKTASTPKAKEATKPSEETVKPVEDVKIENADKDIITPTPAEAGQVGPKGDEEIIEGAKAVSTSENSTTQEYADDKDSKAKVKEHADFVDDLVDGKVKTAADSPSDLAEIAKPLVADSRSGQPKYESASQYIASEQAKGNL